MHAKNAHQQVELESALSSVDPQVHGEGGYGVATLDPSSNEISLIDVFIFSVGLDLGLRFSNKVEE